MARVPFVGVTGEVADLEPESQVDSETVEERRGAGLAHVLAFLIGVVVQIAIPLTNLYDIPNVRAVFFAFILGLFVLRFLSGESIRVGSPLLLSYLCLSLILTAGILYSRAPVYGTNKVILVSSYFWLLGTVVYNLVDEVSVGRAFLSGLFVGGLFLIGVTAGEFGNPIDMFRTMNRFFRLHLGDEGNPIMLARHLALAVTMIITCVAMRRKWIDAVWCIPLTVLALAYLVGTGSKGPLLALLLSGVLTAMVMLKGIVARVCMSLFLVGAIVFAVVGALEFLPKGFVEQRFTEKVENLSMRLPGYSALLRVLLESDPVALLIGHGTGDYGYFSLGHDGRYYPHNMFLEVAYENGIVGVCVLTAAACYPLVVLIRAARLQLETTHRVLLGGLSASYMAALINAQVSGDLGANFLIGIFGAATTSVGNIRRPVPALEE